jgi:hypothetical protein
VRRAFLLVALAVALMLTGCGGGSGSYSPPPTSTKNEANLMRSERGAPAKRSKREDPVETHERPYPG